MSFLGADFFDSKDCGKLDGKIFFNGFEKNFYLLMILIIYYQANI